MAGSWVDENGDSNYGSVLHRPAKPGERAFYGGPLDGSFDFAAEDDETLEWKYHNTTETHIYERDVRGILCYRGVKKPDYPGAPEP